MFENLMNKVSSFLAEKFWKFICDLWDKSKVLTITIVCICGVTYYESQNIWKIIKHIPYISLDKNNEVSELPEKDVILFNNLEQRLKSRIINDLNSMIKKKKPTSPWALANIVSALNTNELKDEQISEIKNYFKDEMTRNTNCWSQYKQKEADPICHIGGTAWIILALVKMELPVPSETIEFLLNAQNSEDGWWATYEGGNSIKENAGTYATSMVIIALSEYLNKGQITPDEKPIIQEVISKASTWLLNSGEGGECRWKDYPNRANKFNEFKSLSGLAIYALNISGYPGLTSINKGWSYSQMWCGR